MFAQHLGYTQDNLPKSKFMAVWSSKTKIWLTTAVAN